MTTYKHRPDFVIYQPDSDDMLGEPAILVRKWEGTFEIAQKGESLIFNYETIPELIKVLREIQKNPQPGKP